MIFSEKIVYSEKVKNYSNFDDFIESVKCDKPIIDSFLICVNLKSDSLFDIMSTREMFKKFINVNDYIIIGIAGNKKDAFLLLKNIVEENYNEYGTLDNIKNVYPNNLH